MPRKHALDFAKLDPVAVQLHLIVPASRNRMLPSARNRHRLRLYRRSPGTKGCSMNRDAVSREGSGSRAPVRRRRCGARPLRRSEPVAAGDPEVQGGVVDGTPNGIGSSSGPTSCTVDQTVVSVGPSMFHSEPTRGSSIWARSRGSASPPHRALRRAQPGQPESINTRHPAGVACITVTPRLSISCASRRPSSAVLPRGNHDGRAGDEWKKQLQTGNVGRESRHSE